MKQIPTISGLKEIYNNYDIFLFDQWGVMHDGYSGYKKAIECINKLIQSNKILKIISNSSKRTNDSIKRLKELGFEPNHFKKIVTSGEMIWQSILNKDYSFTENLGNKCFYIYDQSNSSGEKYIKDLKKLKFVDDINKADFILGCTPFHNIKLIEYIPILQSALKNELPFICANPDFDVYDSKSEKLIFCMGTIAELYKNMGGEFFALGKPNIKIYEEVVKNSNNIDKSKILAIGDSLFHDIKGAYNFGIDSLLITKTGIHQSCFDYKKPDWKNNKNSLIKYGIEPTYLCSQLIF